MRTVPRASQRAKLAPLRVRVAFIDGLWRAYLDTLRSGTPEEQRLARAAWERAS